MIIAGAGGADLYRRNYGETMGNIAGATAALGQALGELEAVAGLVAGQLQAADEFAGHPDPGVGNRQQDAVYERIGDKKGRDRRKLQ